MLTMFGDKIRTLGPWEKKSKSETEITLLLFKFSNAYTVPAYLNSFSIKKQFMTLYFAV